MLDILVRRMVVRSSKDMEISFADLMKDIWKTTPLIWNGNFLQQVTTACVEIGDKQVVEREEVAVMDRFRCGCCLRSRCV